MSKADTFPFARTSTVFGEHTDVEWVFHHSHDLLTVITCRCVVSMASSNDYADRSSSESDSDDDGDSVFFDASSSLSPGELTT